MTFPETSVPEIAAADSAAWWTPNCGD